jgi:hypothetical protein
MRKQRIRRVSADLLAETACANALAVRLDKSPGRPIDGKQRRVVVYAAPGVSTSRMAGWLRELADELECGTGSR